jgi:hypothetical protein
MNRKKFLSLLSLGAVAAAVAPQVLIPGPVEIGPKEILAMREQMAKTIANMPNSIIYRGIESRGWYAEQEALARAELQKQIEWSWMFGKIERPEPFDKYYARATDGFLCNQE